MVCESYDHDSLDSENEERQENRRQSETEAKLVESASNSEDEVVPSKTQAAQYTEPTAAANITFRIS